MNVTFSNYSLQNHMLIILLCAVRSRRQRSRLSTASCLLSTQQILSILLFILIPVLSSNARQIEYTFHFSVPLAFNKSSEYQSFLAIFPYYVPKKLQIPHSLSFLLSFSLKLRCCSCLVSSVYSSSFCRIIFLLLKFLLHLWKDGQAIAIIEDGGYYKTIQYSFLYLQENISVS